MAIKRFQLDDEAGFLKVGGQISDDDDGGWAGIQRCFAGIALAATLAASAFASNLTFDLQQDPEQIPAGSLAKFSTPDEDFWKNPVNPIATGNYVPLPYLPDTEEIPAGSLHGQADEDFWKNPVSPIATANYVPLPYLPDAEEIPAGSLHGQPDEDFWINSVAPVAPAPPALYQQFPCLPDLNDDPAGSLAQFTTPDEDYWQNPVPAGTGQNPVPCSLFPVPSTIFQPLPYLFDAAEIELGWGLKNDQNGSGSGTTVSCAAFANPLTAGSTIFVCVMAETTSIPAPTDTAGNSYTDCGAGNVLFNSGAWTIRIFLARNSSTISANVVQVSNPASAICYVQASEWATSFPSQGVVGWVSQLNASSGTGGGQNVTSGYVATRYDRDLLIALACCASGSVTAATPFSPMSTPSGAFSPAFYIRHGSGNTAANWSDNTNNDPYAAILLVYSMDLIGFDETTWQNPVPPAPPTFYQCLPYEPEPEEIAAGALLEFATPDEECWPPLAVATGGWQPLIAPIAQSPPRAFADTEELPTAPTFQPDEDFWQNPLAALPAAVSQRLPYLPDPTDEPAGSLARFTSPDEDCWPPLAVATGGWQLPQISQIPLALYQPLPIATGESADITAIAASQLDEDYWQNPVFPAAAVLFQRALYLPEVSDEPAGSLYGVPEETEWQNRAAPLAPATFQRLPYLPEVSDELASPLYALPEETEWQNRVAPVAARVFQLLPYASGEAAETVPAFVSDDDCWPPLAIARGGWQNPIIPRQAACAWAQPAVYGFDEFSSFWWTSKWGVRTHSEARQRVLHSTARERVSRSTARPRTSRGISRQSLVPI